MASLRILFAGLAVIGAVQAAPRGHCPGGGDRNGDIESVGSHRPSHTNGTVPMPTVTGGTVDEVDVDQDQVPSGTVTGLSTPTSTPSGVAQAIINNTLLDTTTPYWTPVTETANAVTL